MPDRTIVWGDPADAGTKYRTQDDASAGGGNFVIVEDLDGNTVLLQWNPTAGQFEYQGPVDMGGNDLNNVGTASVTALEAGQAAIGGWNAWTEIDTVTPSNESFKISSIPSRDYYLLELTAEVTDTSTGDGVYLRFNDASDGNNNHAYLSADGSVTSGVDDIETTNINGSYGFASVDFIGIVSPGVDGRPSININQLGREAVVGGYTDWGGFQVDGSDVTSIEVTSDAGVSAGELTLYGR